MPLFDRFPQCLLPVLSLAVQRVVPNGNTRGR